LLYNQFSFCLFYIKTAKGESLYFSYTSTFLNRSQNKHLLSKLIIYTVSIRFKYSFTVFLAYIISNSMVLKKKYNLNILITRTRLHARVQKPLTHNTFSDVILDYSFTPSPFNACQLLSPLIFILPWENKLR
jgi:hypothetical protein